MNTSQTIPSSPNSMHPKLIALTAPSGAGKTTIARHLLNTYQQLAFSISATTRAKRPHEAHGKDYYFLPVEEFHARVENEEFVEWEEVYEGQYYGTLKREIDRILADNKFVIFDIDVKGAQSIKKVYAHEALVIFIQPPSPEVLFERLKNRKTEDSKSLEKRIARAARELTYADKFDRILINDNLDIALCEAEKIIEETLNLSVNSAKKH